MNDLDNGLEPGRFGRESGSGNDMRTIRSLARTSGPPVPYGRGYQAEAPAPIPLPVFDNEEKRRFSLGDYFGLVWRGKWLIVACIIAVGLAAAYYTYSLPFVYQSSLQVLINEKDRSADVFSSRSDMAWVPPERILKKELQILISQPVRESAAAELVERRWLDSARRDSLIPIVSSTETLLRGRLKKLSPEEGRKLLTTEVAARLSNIVLLTPSKEADVIKISVRTGDPVEAALITNIYAQAYQQDNQEQNRASAKKLKTFVGERMQSTRDSLARHEQNLKSYREQNGILGIPGQSTDLLAASSKLSDDAATTRIQITALTRKLAEERRQLQLLDSALPRQVTEAFPAQIASLVQQKASLVTQREMILAGRQQYASQQWYQTQLARLDNAIASLTTKIREESERYKRSQTGMTASVDGIGSTALSGLRMKIIDDQIELESLRARLSEITVALGTTQSKMSSIPRNEMDMQGLERDRKTLEELYQQLNQKYYQSVLEEQSVFSNVRILETALPSFAPISPNRMGDIITGCIVGLGLGIGVVLLIAFIDTTIHTPDDLEKGGFTMLAAIPTVREEMLEQAPHTDFAPNGRISPHLLTQADPKSPIAESYRGLRTALQFAAIDAGPSSVILFTSSTPQEGKSTTSVNTSIVFAQTGARTLLVDCDLRRPILHSVFGYAKEPGLVNCLVGRAPLDEAIHRTTIANLDLLTSGSIPPNPSELLGSQRMRDLLDELRERYDAIIIDSPPSSAVTDAAILSTMSDLSVLVVRAHRTKVEFLEKTREELQRVFVNPLGVVLNDFDISQSYGSAYKYYRYYKYYGYYGQSQEARKRKTRRATAAIKSFMQ